ncbi:MAG: mercury(II) reductase [Anaerolineae bacterium]|jgi:mercury(II) reductase|nr:mercury(II) reductase [Anaerolineae bacterium]MCB1715177.1 mercury(II) reductase [Candidatus Competibacteraceae bacterium]MCB1808338.1 mercury(II) reductase [Candidatus Competibacteraceae bacterium]
MTNPNAACCPSASKPTDADYDIVVIGAGSAGFSAAITAAEQGARVALIGAGTMGGTCVNVGCVPSKTLLRAAETIHHAQHAERFAGIAAQARLTNWSALVAQKQALVDDLRQAKYLDLLAAYDQVTYLEGPAKLVDGGVAVADTLLPTDKVIIATGTRPAQPSIAGIDAIPYLTSTTALELNKPPASLLVIGGGYIGCELAQLFARVGVKVTLVTRHRLLAQGEPEISVALSGYLRDEGIEVIDQLTYTRLQQTSTGITLTIAKDGQHQPLQAEQVLVATGRTPNVEQLGLAAVGVTLNDAGGIAVDDRLRTQKKGVYAAGDVTGQDQFVYMAAYGAKIAANNALNGDRLRYDNTAMPAVVFTDPQVASVGLTEAQARQVSHAVRTSVLDLNHVPRALAARDTRGLIKLVADGTTQKLLGAHILAPEGADSIQTAALAIQQGLTITELGNLIFPYLTTVEGLKLAAQTFDKDVSKLSCCAG